MNNTLKVSKYLFQDFKKAMQIFYAIIFAIAILLVMLNMRIIDQGTTRANFGGFGFAAVIFLFISGLNCFTINFKFLQANNISRKRFYYANILTLTSVSAFMALIDTVMTQVLKSVLPYNSLFEQLYKGDFFFADFMWSFALFILNASMGWCIIMLYYKCNKLLRTVISLAPILIIILLIMLNNVVMGAIGEAIIEFLTVALGFSNNNPYMAVLSFFIATAGVFGLCYLLIRRMPIKE
jgi:hypothetical protein